MSHTIILVPFIAAFLIFILRFYARENAASMANPSFVLAAVTVVVAGTYLLLGVADAMFAHAEVVFGVIGVLLAATAIACMFMI